MVLMIQEVVLRLILATVLGGLIGVERETMRRAAGFRTHILVCSAAALIMLLSTYIFETYRYYTNLDPARLGAQVISGIGFLGAGTIIKEGSSIKGLTTAASLWAVACIGLATGIGFYTGAIATTLVVLITLKVFSRVELWVPDRRGAISVRLVIDNIPGQIGKIAAELGKEKISITNISMEIEWEESKTALLNLRLKSDPLYKKDKVLAILSNVSGIHEVIIL